MVLLETLTATIGTAVAKTVLRLWLGDAAAGEAAAGIADIVSTHVNDFRERRRVVRQFESIAEQIADRLGPFFEHEFASGLPENEQNAAALAVASALDAADLSLGGVVAHDLDPLLLERTVRARTPDAAGRAYLNEAATQLFDFALRESCNYVVEIVVTLPRFTEAATREILTREGELSRLVHQVLDQLPSASQQASVAQAQSEQFETQYRREIARKLDRLVLFGLDQADQGQRYALSVAYITLSALSPLNREDAQRTNRKGQLADKRGGSRSSGESARERHRATEERPAEDSYFSVDQIMADSTRSFIRGQAGSGKTTLLQWLAVTCAKKGFTEPLVTLNVLTSFFVQLCRYVDQDLPTPEQFIRYTAGPLAGIMPDHWVHDTLAAGKALILVDGVDELPEDQREDAREWLTDLCNAFPDARYVVTSRPPAVSDTWLDGLDFVPAELQPMEVSDIEAFVEHWHAAARRDLRDDEESDELAALEDDLLATIRTVRPIRVLATSPLLCAMLCTLNRSRRAQLPRDRVELYRIALETLLVRRDIERRVQDPIGPELSLARREILLRELAYWLLLNGRADVDRTSAVSLLSNRLGAMPQVQASPGDVLDHLILRSGVLREPVVGRIDFIHRTFQEYLAAGQAVEENHIGLLLDRAYDDTWAEVIVLAAGIGNRTQREELVAGLLDRGNHADGDRHRLHLIAVACLESSPELEPGLASRVTKELSRLLPPTSMGEARAVASAGDLAAPLLGKFARSKVATARASIRALALIGTPAALDALQPYARDRRKTVVRELIRAWSQFDGEEFATRILRDAPLGSGTITVSDGAVLPFIFHLTRLKGLAYEGRWTMALTELSEPELVTSLSITRRYPRQDIEGFERFARLRSLNIAEPGDLEDISMLGGLPVTEVHLDGAHKLQDASALADCHALRLLDLDNTGISDLGFVAGTPALRHLWIGSTLVADVGPLQNAQRLRMLHMSNCERVRTIDGLSGLAELRWLWMGGCEQLASISGLEGCGQLEVLYLDGCSGLSDLGPIAQLDNLDELSLSHTSVRRLPSGAAWPSLRRLNLDGCRSLSLLGELDGLDGLVHLHCNDCVALESIDAVQACRAMRNLQMAGCVNVTDLSVVSRLPNLLTIDVSHCSPELDLVPLARHPRLRSIRATGMEAACERAGLVPVSSSPLGRYTTQRYRPRSRTSGS